MVVIRSANTFPSFINIGAHAPILIWIALDYADGHEMIQSSPERPLNKPRCHSALSRTWNRHGHTRTGLGSELSHTKDLPGL